MRLTVGGRLALVALATGVATAVTLSVLLAVQLSDSGQREAAAVTRSVAETLAHEPETADLIAAEDSAALQPVAEAVMADADVSFITMMSPDAIRLTHRDRDEIGLPYLGSTAQALAGETFTEVYEGTLGVSVRTIVPVYAGGADDGDLVGLISVGETLGSVQAELAPRVPLIVVATALIVGLGLLGAWFVRRSVRRVAGELTPDELTRLVANYETVLHSIREGLVVTDGEGRIRLYNDEAADLLGLPPASSGPAPLDPDALDIAPSLREALRSGRRVVEETITNGERVLLVNQEEARDLQGRRSPERGHVMTLRDRSELQALLGELAGVRTLSETLRAQTHEHGNRLHTVLALLELDRPDEARALLAASVDSRQGLADSLAARADSAVVAALLLGKLDDAAERGIRLDVDVSDPAPSLHLPPAEAVTVIGNLLDNALDAASDAPAPRWARVSLGAAGGATVLEVSDSGAGFDETLTDPFAFGATTKTTDAAEPRGIGLALVRDIVAASGGAVAVTSEPTTVRVSVPGDGT